VKIRKIEAPKQTEKLKVAAYARVSTVLENQQESFTTQVNYYTDFIEKVPNWDFVKVYADNGISGLSAEKRPEFMQMIEDACNGQIDLILVKSVSRFCRNFSQAQHYSHLLKAHNVEVRFEREEITNLDPQAEMVFNFLAIIAEQESKSISKNVRWAYEKLAKQGIRHLGNNRVLGYDEVDGKLVPNDDAEIVKMAFLAYAEGAGIDQILRLFNESGIVRMRSKKAFNRTAIYRMFKNEIYVGDRLLQKKPHLDVETKKPDPDIPYTSYYLTDDHEGIVSRDLWNEVRQRLEKQSKDRQNGICKTTQSHFLYGKIFCGECGAPFTRITISYQGEKQKCWKCAERLKGKKGNGCKNITISERELFTAIFGDDEAFLHSISEKDFERVDRIEVMKDGQLEIILKEDEQKTA